MRPAILDPLFAPVTVIDGIGEKIGKALIQIMPAGAGMDVPRMASLVFHLPVSIIDRTFQPGIAKAPEGMIATLQVRIDRHQPSPRGVSRVPYKVFAHDDTGEIALTFFNGRASYLERALPVGEDMMISGRVEWFNGRPSMVHPDHMVPVAKSGELPLVEPVYGLTAGVSPKVLRKAIGAGLARLPELRSWLDPAMAERERFPPFSEALQALHAPQTANDLDLQSAPRRRLAYDELLAGQLALAMVRRNLKRSKGRATAGAGEKRKLILDAFGWPLTGAQERTISEISTDMGSEDRMLRLLQGDVGSGKTIVALLAMASAAECGLQSALMAPTEVLARQHLATILPLAYAAGLRAAILTGREKGREREQILADLAAGEIDILIGTHAIFQEHVTFKDLGLAVIDEQHRFGVHQRLMLSAKGEATDMLVMTATPIPRTLVLTAYGDMDVSRLDEKPANRKPIITTAIGLEQLAKVVQRVRAALDDGKKIYWICPLVEDSEELPVTSVEARHASLTKAFSHPVGIVHGKMKSTEKDAAMAAFKNGETRLLVSTTVIEVGVDVPDATIMVIEHAERFGLAQLHQLRGRVGRGDEQSSCLLLYKEPLGETAKARLSIMRETNDGFLISEEDLKLRGEGELLGTRQSGVADFRLARVEAHGDLLEIARNDTRYILETDPNLESDRGKALRVLLYLFERDAAIKLLKAG
ncbi:MAG: ATP-dependent DNA helicase RecG [Pseudomonadota bacterium]